MKEPMNSTRTPDSGLILLAAGNSRRMGRPKQLLPFGGKNLMQICLDTASSSGARPILVVLGASEDQIPVENSDRDLIRLVNPNWAEGIGSSIRFGIRFLIKEFPGIGGVLLMSCDQPFLEVGILLELLREARGSRPGIAASLYDGHLGIPVYFSKDFFGELSEIAGDHGARDILKRNQDLVRAVPFLRGGFDLDTPEEYERILGGQ